MRGEGDIVREDIDARGLEVFTEVTEVVEARSVGEDPVGT